MKWRRQLRRAILSLRCTANIRHRLLGAKVGEAQYLIAQERRFENWAAVKRHVAEMTREREFALTQAALPPHARSLLDGDLRTLHIRCGSDLKIPLQNAGFGGLL